MAEQEMRRGRRKTKTYYASMGVMILGSAIMLGSSFNSLFTSLKASEIAKKYYLNDTKTTISTLERYRSRKIEGLDNVIENLNQDISQTEQNPEFINYQKSATESYKLTLIGAGIAFFGWLGGLLSITRRYADNK